jgi:hypothetical protein
MGPKGGPSTGRITLRNASTARQHVDVWSPSPSRQVHDHACAASMPGACNFVEQHNATPAHIGAGPCTCRHNSQQLQLLLLLPHQLSGTDHLSRHAYQPTNSAPAASPCRGWCNGS